MADAVDYDDLSSVKIDYHLVTSISILVFSFSIQFMTFPTYVELEKRTTARYASASKISTAMFTIAFLSTGIVGVLLFGNRIYPDILKNIADRPGKVSVLIRLAYSILLLLHIPYFFFTVKEYTLVFFDEMRYRSMSQHLEMKLAEMGNKKNDDEDTQPLKQKEPPKKVP